MFLRRHGGRDEQKRAVSDKGHKGDDDKPRQVERLFCLPQVNKPAGMIKRDLVLTTIPYLQSNLKALKTLRATNAVADDLVSVRKSF